MRDYVGTLLCIVSIALGATAIARHWSDSAAMVLMNVAFLWLLVSLWLGDWLTQAGFARLQKPISAIYGDAKKGKLPRSRRLVRSIETGAFVVLLAALVSVFLT